MQMPYHSNLEDSALRCVDAVWIWPTKVENDQGTSTDVHRPGFGHHAHQHWPAEESTSKQADTVGDSYANVAATLAQGESIILYCHRLSLTAIP